MSKYKLISLSIKIAIVVAAVYFIYNKVFKDVSVIDLWVYVYKIITSWQLILILLMMLLNWLIESYKWKILVQRLEHVSIYSSLKAIFTGITVGIITPNRVGEFGGRVIFLKTSNRIKGTIYTLFGSFSQLLVTVFLGLIAFYLMPPNYIMIQELKYIQGRWILLLVIISFLIFIISPLLSKALFLKFKWKTFLLFENIDSFDLLKVFSLSMLRYFVFSMQFFLLLSLSGIQVSYYEGSILIALTFFISSVLPVMAFAEFITRGAASVAVMGAVIGNNNAIFSASLMLWGINVALPAFIGSIFLMKAKLFVNE